MAGRIRREVSADKSGIELRVTGDRLQVTASNCLLSVAEDARAILPLLLAVPCTL
jgi:hypothetical protein